jgi:hypothetical protein
MEMQPVGGRIDEVTQPGIGVSGLGAMAAPVHPTAGMAGAVPGRPS